VVLSLLTEKTCAVKGEGVSVSKLTHVWMSGSCCGLGLWQEVVEYVSA